MKPVQPRDGRGVRILLGGLAVLLIAGIVHIVSLLAMPWWLDGDAYAVLTRFDREPLKTVVAAAAAKTVFPYRDPALATAFCLYDLASGPVRVSLDVAAAEFGAVSVHDRRGQPVYVLTNRSASQGVVTLVLMTGAQAAAAEAAEPAEGSIPALRVALADAKGFVAAQVLAGLPSAEGLAEDMAKALACKQNGD